MGGHVYNKSCAAEWGSKQEKQKAWRGIEVVITRRSWKPFVRKGAWVRIPPSPLKKHSSVWKKKVSLIGEVPKLAEGAPLERE